MPNGSSGSASLPRVIALALVALQCAACAAVPMARTADACAAAPLDVGRVGQVLQITRVRSGSDGLSHAERIELPGKDSTYLGMVLTQFDFGDPTGVVFVRGPPNFDIPVHPAPYREIFMTLSGSATSILSDGTRVELTPGSLILFEDYTGAGHGGKVGPCGYVSLDIQYRNVRGPPPAPQAAPQAAP